MRSIILRKVAGQLSAFWRTNGGGFAGGAIAASFPTVGIAILTLALVAILWVATFGMPDLSLIAMAGFGFAGTTVADPPSAIDYAKAKKELPKIHAELKKGMAEMSKGAITAERGEQLDALAKQAESLQEAVDVFERIRGLVDEGEQIVESHLPGGDEEEGEPKSRRRAQQAKHRSPGALVARSEEYKSWVKNGRSGTIKLRVDTLDPRVVAMKRAIMQGKAVPTIGAGVIEADRDTEAVRTPEMDRLTLRDVLNVSGTDSNAVQYVVTTPSTAPATTVATGGLKPEANMAFAVATAPVETIAVHIPVPEQTLADFREVENIIDVELTYEVRREEERQILYGNGTTPNLQGLIPLGGVAAITRTVTNTTNLDRIRIGMTDILMAGGEPNAVVIHPLDWEAIVLLKATDNKYIWVVVTDPQTGNSRVWGISVVETVAAKNPANNIRNMVVGDWQRGAKLWVRDDVDVEVGYINDQFVRNLRTIRAEERAAFGIKRPTFFRKYETQSTP